MDTIPEDIIEEIEDEDEWDLTKESPEEFDITKESPKIIEKVPIP